MKQLLFILFIFQFSTNILVAKEKTQDAITWDIIAERLFNGDSKYAFRFEDDIEFKLTGATPQDSAIVKEIIIELNELIETVNVKFADNYGNFSISLLTVNHQVNKKPMLYSNKGNINTVKLEIITENLQTLEEKRRYFYYYIFRNLTKAFEPSFGKTDYNGVFEANTFPQFNRLSDLDKDIIRKLYSKDFYPELRKNIVANSGYLYYFKLRWKNWMKTITTSVSIFLLIIGFLYLLSRKKNNLPLTFWTYQKKAWLIILWSAFSVTILLIPDSIPAVKFNFNIWVFNLGNFIALFMNVILAPAILYYMESKYLRRFNNFFKKQIFIFISTFASIILSYVIISTPFVYLNAKHQMRDVVFFEIMDITRIYFIVIIAALRVLYNFIHYRIQSMVNQKDVEIAKMKELKNQAELNALHSRINPHFLYNSLNSIASLAHIDADKTENMATGLSELFRYSINKENKTFVTVAEELEMVEKYLEIEKTRFGDRLSFEISTDEGSMEKQIPKFLIQPLVENAIKHGLSKIKSTGKVSVEVKQAEKNLTISIADNGPNFPAEPVSGYGLQNLHDKLDIIYGNDAGINWENGENKHIQIILKNQFNV
ncbi:MAG: sensor histidine kinase [Draconibacterium sp.]